MPELPDILLYLHALRPRIVGQQPVAQQAPGCLQRHRWVRHDQAPRHDIRAAQAVEAAAMVMGLAIAGINIDPLAAASAGLILNAAVLGQRLDCGKGVGIAGKPGCIISQSHIFATQLGSQLQLPARRDGEMERPVRPCLNKRCGRQAMRCLSHHGSRCVIERVPSICASAE